MIQILTGIVFAPPYYAPSNTQFARLCSVGSGLDLKEHLLWDPAELVGLF